MGEHRESDSKAERKPLLQQGSNTYSTHSPLTKKEYIVSMQSRANHVKVDLPTDPAVMLPVDSKDMPRFTTKESRMKSTHSIQKKFIFTCSWIRIFLFILLSIGVFWMAWTRFHPISYPVDISSKCQQPKERIPKQHSELDAPFEQLFHSSSFRHQVAMHLSQAIEIETVSFDEKAEGGKDRYKGFLEFHAFLERAYPLIHRHLTRHVVANYSLVYIWDPPHARHEWWRWWWWKDTQIKKKPLMLCSHMDTVPVPESTRSQWIQGPFSGHIDDDYVWGRGASDTKCTLVEIMESVELLLKQGLGSSIALERPLIIAFGHDEEIGGPEGAANIAQFLLHQLELEDGVEMIIGEGPGLEYRLGEQFGTIGTTEKGYVDMTLTLETEGGHSSVPPPRTGAGYLSELMYRIEKESYSPALLDTSPFLESLYCRVNHVKNSTHIDPYLPWALSHLDQARPELIRRLGQASRATKAMNALPELSVVKMNHRVAHHESISTVEQHLLSIMKRFAEEYKMSLVFYPDPDHMEWIIHTTQTSPRLSLITQTDKLVPAPISPMFGDEIFDLLGGTIQSVFNPQSPWSVISSLPRSHTLPNSSIIITPSIMLGNTDTRHYWNLTRHIYRFSPNREGYAVGRFGVHTVNERNSINSLVEGVVFYYQLIRNVHEFGSGGTRTAINQQQVYLTIVYSLGLGLFFVF